MEVKEVFSNIFRIDKKLATRNLVPGHKTHGEELVKARGVEYRSWSPYRSKLAAAIEKKLGAIPVKPGASVLYLGAANGYTPSFVSDIVGGKGVVYCIELSARAMRDLLRVCEKRENMLPILADARNPGEYEKELEHKVDVIYEDVADPQQASILIENSRFLKKEGMALIAVKARAINSVEEPERIYERVVRELKPFFEVIEEKDLHPFEKDHLFLALKKRG